MGLDIVAYKNLKKVEEPALDENGYLINYEVEWRPGDSMKWSERHFKGRAEGLDADTVYTFEETYSFCAGSYSGYGCWRGLLNEFKGNIAFKELINFADNEGVIGPIVSKKLYKDFKNYENEAENFSKALKDGDWFIRKYRDWLRAFELASEDGAVDFV